MLKLVYGTSESFANFPSIIKVYMDHLNLYRVIGPVFHIQLG